jgi:hypothetical protein
MEILKTLKQNDDVKEQKKSLQTSQKRKELSERAFTSMLITTSRNHYIMNQMVDRKARILLSIDALIISLIIGKIIINQDMHYFMLILLVVAGFTTFSSIFYSMLAITPEVSHGKLSTEELNSKKGNPLFFGNFKDLKLSDYKKAMLSMTENVDLIHSAIIEDIFYLGKALERKRLHLKYSLYILVAGVFIALIMGLIFRLVYGEIQ